MSRYDTVQHWAAGLFARANDIGPTPLAGSPEWSALDNHDPRKCAAVIRAALAWLHEGTPEAITARLKAELDQLDRLHSDRMRALSGDLSAAADWSRIANGPTRTALDRRRTTRPCPQCPTPLLWTDTRCPDCGWTEPTPQETRATARQSWTRYDQTITETAA